MLIESESQLRIVLNCSFKVQKIYEIYSAMTDTVLEASLGDPIDLIKC